MPGMSVKLNAPLGGKTTVIAIGKPFQKPSDAVENSRPDTNAQP